MGQIDETNLSIMKELRMHIEHYLKLVAEDGEVVSKATVGYWNRTILPLVRTAGKALSVGRSLSKTEVIFLTGRYTSAELEMLVVNRSEWAILEQASSLPASAAAKRMLGCLNVLGIALMLSGQADAETYNENKWSYENYVRKYLMRFVKVAGLGGHHVNNLQPPLTYEQWWKTVALPGASW